jgi:hypothetical protein
MNRSWYADKSVAIDQVLVEHRYRRKNSSPGEYQQWFTQECPKLLPATKATSVMVTGQGTFQGGSTSFRIFDKKLRNLYHKKILEATSENVSTVKVWRCLTLLYITLYCSF